MNFIYNKEARNRIIQRLDENMKYSSNDIDKLKKQKELTLLFNNEDDFDYLVEEVYNLYKEEIDETIELYKINCLLENNFLANDNNHIWFQKLLCAYNKTIYPNSYSIIKEDIEWGKRITYYQRIAGIYNPITKEHEIGGKHQYQHQISDKMFDEGWTRYYIQDYKNIRRLNVSGIDYDNVIKAYNFLKRYYQDAMIELYIIDWVDENHQQQTMYLDSSGHKTIMEIKER